MANTTGLCECGCGQKTTVSPKNNSKDGYIKGVPRKYLRGHAPKPKGKLSTSWKGGTQENDQGYVLIKKDNHLRADSRGYVREHILIAENVLGKVLPFGAEVHHINGIRNDNKNNNLIICQDRDYHFLLHRRTIALRESVNATFRKCWYCKKYDDPKGMIKKKYRNSYYHQECQAAYVEKKYYANKNYFKGSNRHRGSKSHFSKLKEAEVIIIKKLLIGKSFHDSELGRIFEVSGANIGYIKSGKNWNHINIDQGV